MGKPIDPSINSIVPLKTQQVANDAQNNSVEEAQNFLNIEEVEDVQRSPNKRCWKKIEKKWKAICKYCEKKLGGNTTRINVHLKKGGEQKGSPGTVDH